MTVCARVIRRNSDSNSIQVGARTTKKHKEHFCCWLGDLRFGDACAVDVKDLQLIIDDTIQRALS